MFFFKFFYKISLFLFLTFVITIIGLYSYAYFSSPIDLNVNQNFYLYDNDENLIYQGSNVNSWVKLKNINENLVNAIISVEDKNFYEHNGFDYLRIISAMFTNLKNKKIVEGASTISQQYIKNAYLDFSQTWARKIKEALMTLNLEVHYSKNEILEAYLNTINFGNGNYGINSAAKYYFNKTPDTLTLEESAILAGIPKSPSNYNPIANYNKAYKRAKTVALTMYNNKYITYTQYDNLLKNKIDIYGKKTNNDLQMLMYYQDAVIKELKSINSDFLKRNNIKIFTSLDFEAQKNLEKTILKYIDDKDLQVASVIINPNNGGIMALTGGIDYIRSQYNRALYSKRQVGSTMKPFLYYSALASGMTSSSTFTSEFTTFNLSNGKTYSPKNYANVYANKNITMAAAISYSDNIYAVKTNLFLGVDKLLETTKKCGINENLQEVVSLALGTSEINILDFANGYTTLASGGYKKNLHFIERIEDDNGNILFEYEKENNLVLNPNYVYILNELLTSTTSSAFIDYNTPTALGIASKLSQKYAIKTGTTDTDYWTIGYNKNSLMLVWTGYDDNRKFTNSMGTKSKNIWADVMESIANHENDNWYSIPNNVVGMPLNSIDGAKITDNKKANIFYYLKGSEPIQ